MLKDKVGIVTGSTKGIGRATAIILAKEGADIVITGRSEERAKEVATQVEAHGRRALVILADVTKTEEVNRVIDKTLEEFGKVDILVNNAASVGKIRSVVQMEDADWNVLDTDLVGYFRFCRAVIGPMTRQKKGKIINVSTDIAVTGFPGLASLTASKAAIIGFSATLAREVASQGICVNVISPGLVETESAVELFKEIEGEVKGPIFRKVIQEIPMGRLAKPEEVAKVIAFLASDDADYITGQVLRVDGGALIGI